MERRGDFGAARRAQLGAPGEGLAGRVLESGEPERSPAGAAFPIASASGTLGTLELHGAGEIAPELAQVLLATGRHLGERIERERAYEHGQASEARWPTPSAPPALAASRPTCAPGRPSARLACCG